MSDKAATAEAVPQPKVDLSPLERRLQRLEEMEWRELRFQMQRMEEEVETANRLIKMILVMACCAIVYVPAITWGPYFFLLFVAIIA